jgi:hypothetical protein
MAVSIIERRNYRKTFAVYLLVRVFSDAWSNSAETVAFYQNIGGFAVKRHTFYQDTTHILPPIFYTRQM